MDFKPLTIEFDSGEASWLARTLNIDAAAVAELTAAKLLAVLDEMKKVSDERLAKMVGKSEPEAKALAASLSDARQEGNAVLADVQRRRREAGLKD